MAFHRGYGHIARTSAKRGLSDPPPGRHSGLTAFVFGTRKYYRPVSVCSFSLAGFPRPRTIPAGEMLPLPDLSARNARDSGVRADCQPRCFHHAQASLTFNGSASKPKKKPCNLIDANFKLSIPLSSFPPRAKFRQFSVSCFYHLSYHILFGFFFKKYIKNPLQRISSRRFCRNCQRVEKTRSKVRSSFQNSF